MALPQFHAGTCSAAFPTRDSTTIGYPTVDFPPTQWVVATRQNDGSLGTLIAQGTFEVPASGWKISGLVEHPVVCAPTNAGPQPGFDPLTGQTTPPSAFAPYILITWDPRLIHKGEPVVENVWAFNVLAQPPQLPQCSTRTIAEDGTEATQTGALWEIEDPRGRIVSSGATYDRFGPLGWGVVAPGLGGVGTITVTTPRDAIVGSVYTVRTNGHSAIFAVTPGTCPGEGSTPAMPKKEIHSTGLLCVFPKVGLPSLSRINVGAPPANTGVLASGLDYSPATTLDLTFTDGGNRQYLQIDLGTSQTIGLLRLRNVTSTAAVSVYVSATPIAGANFGGATALPSVGAPGPAAGVGLSFESAAGIDGRYLYVVPGANCTIGDVDVRGTRVKVAYLQNITPAFGWEQAVLRDVPWRSQYPVADAQFDPSLTLTCEVASFQAACAEMLLGADMDDTGDPVKLTPALKATPLRFCLEFEARDLDGKAVVWTVYDCVAPGFAWKFGRTAFAQKSFVARCMARDAAGIPWRIELEN